MNHNLRNLIDEKRLVDNFCQIVSTDSPSYQERKLADLMREKLELLGARVKEDEVGPLVFRHAKLDENEYKLSDIPGNLLAVLEGNLANPKENQTKAILLSAHLDTVNPALNKKVQVLSDGRIVSDGTTILGADAGAGLAEILEVLAVLEEHQLPHPDIEVLLCVAEEVYGLGARYFDYSLTHAKLGLVLDAEGEVGTGISEAPSIISLEVEITGKASHAGFAPEKGIDSIACAAEALHQVSRGICSFQSNGQDPQKRQNDPRINFGLIQGGTGSNIIAEQTSLKGEIRSLDANLALGVAQKIKEIFEQTALKFGARVDFRFEEKIRAYQLEPTDVIVTGFRKACAKLGLAGKLNPTYGGSDNNHFHQSGIRALVIACGMHEVHSTREYTTVRDLSQTTQLILEIIQSLMESRT